MELETGERRSESALSGERPTELEASVAAHAAMVDELRQALAGDPPEVPAKYLYDERGSALFERITQLAEYYPTRTERELLRSEASAIIAAAGKVEEVVELGSGAAAKTIPLLHAILGAGRAPHYVALDISRRALLRTGEILQDEPGVKVALVQADYSQGLPLGPRRGSGSRMVIFLGGTIGNETDAGAVELFSRVRAALEPGDSLLVGANLVTEPAIIEAAYNDAAGVTAAFNKNMLHVLNQLVGADFNVDDFDHHAPYVEERRRIEMWLRARHDVRVDLGAIGKSLTLRAGEGIRTEISRRFVKEELEAILGASRFSVSGWFPSEDGRFGLILGRAESLH